MEFQLLSTRPASIWLAVLGADDARHQCPIGIPELMQLDRDLGRCAFRGVGTERFGTVLSTGIDVEPSDSVFFADHFDKAWEYGGFPKLILALRRAGLERTFREMPADSPAEEIAEITARFPTVVPSTDGKTIWCSRMDESDPRVATPYEAAYSWWIPVNPFDALHAVLVFARAEDIEALRDLTSDRDEPQIARAVRLST